MRRRVSAFTLFTGTQRMNTGLFFCGNCQVLECGSKTCACIGTVLEERVGWCGRETMPLKKRCLPRPQKIEL